MLQPMTEISIYTRDDIALLTKSPDQYYEALRNRVFEGKSFILKEYGEAPHRLEDIIAKDKLCADCENHVGQCRCALIEMGCIHCFLDRMECPIGEWKTLTPFKG
jgi:hypothetical protein